MKENRVSIMKVLTIEAYGLKFAVDENARFIVEEAYEPFLKDVVKLAKGDVLVDVGAHVGKYSFYAARLVGDRGIVVAIEPHSRNMANLKRGLSLNGLSNVVTVQKACSNHVGQGFLKEYELSAKHELVQEDTGVKVDVDTLDNILQSLRIRKVSMVKIDVNGHEYEVLQGARRTLEEFKPALIIEVTFDKKTKVLEYLKNYGYEPSILAESKRYQDVLFHSK
jgi:FkbM family methyltransferase